MTRRKKKPVEKPGDGLEVVEVELSDDNYEQIQRIAELSHHDVETVLEVILALAVSEHERAG